MRRPLQTLALVATLLAGVKAPAAAQGEAPVAAPDAPPVIVVPVPGANLTESLASAVLDAVVAHLRAAVQGREVRAVLDPAVVSAVAACAERACLGAQVSAAGGALGVLVRLGRPTRQGPLEVRVELVEPASGEPRGEAVTAQIPPEAFAAPGATLANALGALAPSLPRPPPRPTLLVAVNVDGARVAVDGAAVGEAPLAPLALAPGRHTITVEHPGFVPFGRAIDLAPEGGRLDVGLEPDPTQLESLAALDAEEAAGRPATGDKPWYGQWYVWAGAGGAVVLVAVIAGVAAAAGGGGGGGQSFQVPGIEP